MTQSKLKSLLRYDKETGEFTWIKSSPKMIGKVAGTVKGDSGYVQIQIGNKLHRAHRLVFLYVFGYMPKFVDHENHNRADNSLDNLRDVTKIQNSQNVLKSKRNTSGQVGVSWNKNNNNWRASINVNKKKINLGSFDKFSEAVDARKLAEVAYGFHKNHGR